MQHKTFLFKSFFLFGNCKLGGDRHFKRLDPGLLHDDSKRCSQIKYVFYICSTVIVINALLPVLCTHVLK